MSDFTPAQGIEWGGASGVGRVVYDEGDKALHVTFRRHSERNGLHAIATGGPTFVAKDYVKIFRPAEYQLWVVDREATEDDKRRFPRQWAAYQEDRQQVPDGHPVALLFPHDPDRVANCQALRIQTIEQLAAVTDGALPKLGMGGLEMRDAAKAYMVGASDRDRVVAQAQIVEQQNSVIDDLKRQVAELAALAEKPKQRERAA